jgi:hypothetical protein
MTWAVAIALGAIVAPPDAAAATAVLRQVRMPHRILTILEGESLLNDASAILIYKGAVTAASAATFSITNAAPGVAFSVVGSIILGPILALISMRVMGAMRRSGDTPTNIIMQFIITFGVWLLADRLGLSGVLTIVSYAITAARQAPASTPAHLRVLSYAVWETTVFVLNVLAFVLIGLQIGPILENLWDRGAHNSHRGPHRLGDELQCCRALACAPVRFPSASTDDAANLQGRHSHLLVRHAGHRDPRNRPGIAERSRWRGLPVPRPHRVHRVLCRVRNAGGPGG